MIDPVNLTNLRELTDGDKSLEKELFKEFLSSAETAINELETSSDNKKWYSASHAFKGIAINLGAEKLGELCKQAQDKSEAHDNEKKFILNEIKTEYALVKTFLDKLS